jgi:hypothetical protein
MRIFINVKTSSGGGSSSHARYMSERERDLERESPEARPIFIADRDGVGHRAANSYRSGASQLPQSKEFHRIIRILTFFNPDERAALKTLAGQKLTHDAKNEEKSEEENSCMKGQYLTLPTG